MIYALCVIIIVTTVYLGYVQQKQNEDYKARYHELIGYIERREKLWGDERQQLLDRIQASSFAEYKTQEIKTIKAQQGEQEPPKLEPV